MAGRKARDGGCSRAPRRGDGEGIEVTLDQLAREGARWMIAVVLEAEVDEYVAVFSDELGEDGHRLVVRNGRGKERRVTVGSGTLPIRAPRVNDEALRRRPVSGSGFARGSCRATRGCRRG